MANGKKSFLDHFRISDDDDDDYEDDDDYIFDDDDDEYEETYRKKRPSTQPVKNSPSKAAFTPTRESKPSFTPQRETRKMFTPTQTATDKLVSFDDGARRRGGNGGTRATGEVFVIKPQAFDDAQTVVDFMKKGKVIVINMEGLQLEPAQRIIDFIGGACYGITGELRAISANIFIAVPSNIEVSGDLREEILNTTGGIQY